MRGSSHSSMICTSCADQRELEQCTTSLRHICGTMPAFPSMPGRRECGTEVGIARQLVAALQRAAVAVSPTAIVWRGDHTLPTDQQGLKVLGVPVGTPHFVLKFLEQKIDEQRVLLERIPQVPDTQSAWLLLSYCAAARANFFLRAVNPDLTDQFAASHDNGVWQCLCRISEDSSHLRCLGAIFTSFVERRSGVAQCSTDTARSTLGKLGQTR